jgi:hypothetical protein
MLLGQPCLHNAHVIHDWAKNLIIIESNGMVLTIVVTKHLDSNTKRPQVLLCYDMMEGVIDKEAKILLIIKLDLFMLGTITLPNLEILSAIIFGAKVGIEDLTFNLPHFEGEISVDTIPTYFKVQESKITQRMLPKDH